MDGSPSPRRTLRSAAELAAAGLVTERELVALETVAARYAVAVTPHVLGLIDPADPDDPIARQYVPSAAELNTRPEERTDPIGDRAHSPIKGIVHRYPDRVLLKPTHACAVYCRFCFRREMVGPGGEALSPSELAAALDYIRGRSAVWEVILTGGDPLVLAPRRLAEIMAALGAIAHVGAIRVHTRVPLADPERVSAELVAAFASEKAVHVVVHCNHARELSPPAVAACRRFIDAGIPVLSQSVLLKGVNDTPEALEDLFRALVRHRIRPYYLHQADLAPGTAQFRTSLAEGRALVRALRGRLSGLCQPAYVLDIPGGAGKVPVDSGFVREDGTVADWQGGDHRYP